MLATLILSVSCAKYSADIEPGGSNRVVPLWNAMVTVKSLESGTIYFQLDETTTLQPVSWENIFGKEVRALVNYTELPQDSEMFTKAVTVNRIDSVRTKKAQSLFFSSNAFPGEGDPLEIVDDWLTVCEDGYMNVHFAAQGSAGKASYELSLGIHPDNPYDMYLWLDKRGDSGTTWYNDIVAFDVSDLIPCEEGEVVSLTLHWKSNDGTKTLKFKCKPHRITKL
jgi:hypothetical protein